MRAARDDPAGSPTRARTPDGEVTTRARARGGAPASFTRTTACVLVRAGRTSPQIETRSPSRRTTSGRRKASYAGFAVPSKKRSPDSNPRYPAALLGRVVVHQILGGRHDPLVPVRDLPRSRRKSAWDRSGQPRGSGSLWNPNSVRYTGKARGDGTGWAASSRVPSRLLSRFAIVTTYCGEKLGVSVWRLANLWCSGWAAQPAARDRAVGLSRGGAGVLVEAEDARTKEMGPTFPSAPNGAFTDQDRRAAPRPDRGLR